MPAVFAVTPAASFSLGTSSLGTPSLATTSLATTCANPALVNRSAASGAESARKTRQRPPAARTGLARSLVDVHPALWLAHQTGRQVEATTSTGFALLDAQLPGQGWPHRALSELLLPQVGVGEIRLLAPSLAAIQQAGRLVMLFDPPAELSAQALAQLGLDVPQLLLIQTQAPIPASAPQRLKNNRSSPGLWALEQALKSGQVGAVLAWLPTPVRSEHLRRLQLAAQAHDGPAFVLRECALPLSAASSAVSSTGSSTERHPVAALFNQLGPSPAPLRLGLHAAGGEQLDVHLLKRRGAPLLSPLRLNLNATRPSLQSLRHAVPALASALASAIAPTPTVTALKPATFVNLA